MGGCLHSNNLAARGATSSSLSSPSLRPSHLPPQSLRSDPVIHCLNYCNNRLSFSCFSSFPGELQHHGNSLPETHSWSYHCSAQNFHPQYNWNKAKQNNTTLGSLYNQDPPWTSSWQHLPLCHQLDLRVLVPYWISPFAAPVLAKAGMPLFLSANIKVLLMLEGQSRAIKFQKYFLTQSLWSLVWHPRTCPFGQSSPDPLKAGLMVFFTTQFLLFFCSDSMAASWALEGIILILIKEADTLQ